MASAEGGSVDPLLDTGYYYPEPYWHDDEASWLKSLLLFFDRLAILLPDYMYGRHRDADPALAGVLEDMGLLVVLQPEDFVDQSVTDALIATVWRLLDAGAFDGLPGTSYFTELSRSRLGWNARIELSAELIDELVSRKLAKPSKNGLSVPLHPDVRTTVLVLLSQLARGAGRKRGLDLLPITDDRERFENLLQTLQLPPTRPGAGEVVVFDLETVGFNLEGVALEDILDFRGEHHEQYRTYARSVRKAVAELSASEPEERVRLLEDRRDELGEEADKLRRAARKRWRMPFARFGLGAAGATANAAAGNVPGAILSAISGLLGARPEKAPDSAFSYLFEAERRIRT